MRITPENRVEIAAKLYRLNTAAQSYERQANSSKKTRSRAAKIAESLRTEMRELVPNATQARILILEHEAALQTSESVKAAILAEIAALARPQYCPRPQFFKM